MANNYIESLLENAGVTYKTSAKDVVVPCLNPEHLDSNPSLRIDKATGLFHCLSCGFKGGMHRLHEILGVEAPPAQLLLEVKQAEAFRVLDKLSKKLVVTLPEDRSPVTSGMRNLKPQTLIDHEMYFTPDSPYVSIPIRDSRGKLRFIESRAADDTLPKYLRLPEDVTVDFLWNIDCGSPTLVLVEGLFDYLRLYDLGIRNACPLFGLYNFKKSIVADVKRHGVVKIVTMLDNDTAGQRASTVIRRTAELGGLMTDTLIPETDPGDLTRETLMTMLLAGGYKIQNKFLV